MIYCCGEALIDMLPRMSAEGEPAFVPHAGGAVFNTAIALGRLGAPAGFVSGLSSDFFGDQLRAALIDANVDTAAIMTSKRPTTLAFVRLTDGQASYAFYDENTAGRMLRAADLPALPGAGALFFGGISLVAEPCGTAYEALMARESPARATMLDPNIRPGFITDETAFRARLARMQALTDLVKLSDEDLAWLEGPGTPESLARRVLARGPKAVFITQGAAGALAICGANTVRVAAPKVRLVDTVGAGDTFNAGVLAALHRRGKLDKRKLAALDAADLEAALTLGTKAASLAVARAGADPPWADELEGRARCAP